MVEETLELRAECATKLAKSYLIQGLENVRYFTGRLLEVALVSGHRDRVEYYNEELRAIKGLEDFIGKLPNCEELKEPSQMTAEEKLRAFGEAGVKLGSGLAGGEEEEE